MSKNELNLVSSLARLTGYEVDFLVSVYNEVMAEDGDVDFFIGVTLERDW